MDNHDKSFYRDEIDLKDLFSALWSGKIFIILVSIVSVFYASFYLQSAERKYTIEYNLKPVGETKTSPFIWVGWFRINCGHSITNQFK